MSIAVTDMAATHDAVLFCPFCEESFEGETVCPEHELALVPFEKLPRVVRARREVRDDKELPWWEPRFGRALTAAGAAAIAIGFIGPLAIVSNAGASLAITGPGLAATRLMGFWSVLVVPIVVLTVLGLRRSPARMRGVRIVVPVLGLAAPAVLAWALAGMRAWALSLDGGAISLAWGSVVIALGATFVVVGGLVLGLVPSHAVAPHGAAAEDAESPIAPERKPRKKPR